MTEKYKSEAKKLGEELDKSSRALDRSKQKYRTAYITWEIANNSYAEAERNGNVTPIEVSKLRSVAGSKQHISDDCKGQYAQQLLKTNQFQEQYYFSHLPAVLNNLQNLDHTRISYIKEVLSNCLREERSIVPIVSKCYEGMDTAITGIDPSINSVMVVDKLKTGNVPPPDFTFEEMGGMGRDVNTLSRKSSRNVESNGGNVNFYQKKRELEKRVEDVEKEVEKGQKEMKALQLMVQTYSQNPKFGDAKQFQGELDAATHKVQMFESDLHSLKTELQEVECKLESLKNRSPFPGSTPVSMRKDDISPSGSRTSSVKSGSMSQGYGTISNYSGSDKDSIEGNVIPPGGTTENVDNDANVWGEDEWDDDEI